MFMVYRNPLEVFHYDKPYIQMRNIRANVNGPVWVKLVDLPQYTVVWRVHNRGAFTVRYAYQRDASTWEELEAGVADSKDVVPRQLWIANEEIVAGRNVDVYAEYWVSENEKDRKANEHGIGMQLGRAFKLLRQFWGRDG